MTTSHQDEHTPHAAMTPENWDTVVWLTAELSWWRSQTIRVFGDPEQAEDAIWRMEP